MLSNTLVTNEVKGAGGTEVEFHHLSSNGRQRVFHYRGAQPNLQHTLDISHAETGVGANRVRSSKIGFTIEDEGVAPGTVAKFQAYAVLRYPIGNAAEDTNAKEVLAHLMSFLASNGANTTILYDGSGTGAQCLLVGEI